MIKNKIIDRILLVFTAFFVLIMIALIFSSISVNPPRSKSRDAKRDFDIKQIQIILNDYHDKNNTYPPSLNSISTTTIEFTDPKTKIPYEYSTTKQNKDYQLCVSYEQKNYTCFTSESYSQSF